MKYFIISFLFLTPYVFADEELDLLLEAITEVETTDRLLESPDFQNCATQAQNVPANERQENIRQCMGAVIAGYTPEQLTQLAERLNINSFDPDAVKTSVSLREYLGERLREGLFGRQEVAEGRLQKFREQKQVDHDIFYQLYKEQIGKNTLLTASQYCLENFGGPNPKQIIYLNTDNKVYKFDAIEEDAEGNFKPKGTAEGKTMDQVFAEIVNTQPSTAIAQDPRAYWTSVHTTNSKEYKVCNASENNNSCSEGTSNTEIDKLGVRSAKQISALKQAQLALGATNEELVRVNYNFCLKFTIKKMCAYYKCKSVYDNSENLTQTQINFCQEELGITPTRPTPDPNQAADQTVDVSLGNENIKKGQIACNVMERLNQYRKMTIATTELIEKINRDVQEGRTRLNMEGLQRYENRGRNSVDRLTSISSGELANEVDSISGSEEEAQRLRELCFNEQGQFQEDAGEECQALLAEVDSEEIQNIVLETEGKTALFSEQLQGLTTDEELTEFLMRNGMGEYVDRIEDIDPEELRNYLELEFKAKNQAKLDAIKERFNNQLRLSQTDESNEDVLNQIEGDIADQTVANIEEHKNRVESLFQYSNIVSSYLTGAEQDADGNVIEGTERVVSVTGRNVETADENIQRTDDEEVAAVLQQYSGGSDDGDLPDGSEIGYENIFNLILDFDSESDEQANQGNSN